MSPFLLAAILALATPLDPPRTTPAEGEELRLLSFDVESLDGVEERREALGAAVFPRVEQSRRGGGAAPLGVEVSSP